MRTTEFTDRFPGTHVTSWTDDEGFDMVTVGIPALPGAEASTLWVGDYEWVLAVWDMQDSYRAPRFDDPLFAALDAHMERLYEVGLPGVFEHGHPVTTMSSHDTYPEAREAARVLREARTVEERRDGMEYRIVARTGDPRSHVERFYNWNRTW